MALFCVELLENSSTYYSKSACGFPRRPPCLKPFLAFVGCHIRLYICIRLLLLCRRGCRLFRFHMTTGTVRERECHPVMAPSAIFSCGYLGHRHFRIATRLHLEDLDVAIRAGY